ncbi:unnamed protein product, partial [Symbiodinium sp. CCMP2456]
TSRRREEEAAAHRTPDPAVQRQGLAARISTKSGDGVVEAHEQFGQISAAFADKMASSVLKGCVANDRDQELYAAARPKHFRSTLSCHRMVPLLVLIC